MSYILDALRKADAQRERDASRDIHANPAPLGPAGAGRSRRSRAGMWAAIVVGCAVAIGAGAYFVRDSAAPAPVASNAPAPSLPPAAPLRMTPPQEVAKAIVPPAPPPVAAVAPPPNAPVDQRARQAREAAFSNPAAMQAVPRPIAAPPQPAQVNPQPPAVPNASGLPADAPKVAISGGVYSPSPAQRMLIVNGQVYNEGSEIAPGLTIEKIEARTAVLKFRGALYTVAY